MLAVATEFSLEAWRGGRPEPDAIFEARRERWHLQGVRPFNHPRLRLRQYAEWVSARPDWPERLRRMAERLRSAGILAAEAAGEGSGSVRSARKAANLTGLREHLADELCGGAVSGGRFDNMVCDGFLPLLAAHAGPELEPLWRNWFPGDAPADRAGLLRRLEVFGGAEKPSAHGPLQGLLGGMLARESRAAALPAGRGT